MGLGLSWGIGPNFVMGMGFRLAHEDFGLRFELKPGPDFMFSFGFGFGFGPID